MDTQRVSSNMEPVKKIKNSKFKLIMFDFDGTLVDTAPDIISATNLLLTKNGHKALPADVIRRDIGTGLKTLLKDFFPEANEDPAIEEGLYTDFLDIYRHEFLKNPVIFEGLENFLQKEVPARDLKIAIVSNKKEDLIPPILEKVGLQKYPWVKIIGGNTFEHMKPHPMPILEAISAAGVQPEEAVLVGDGTPDVEGAHAAKCTSVAVSFGYTPIETLMSLGAHFRIDHFDELTQCL